MTLRFAVFSVALSLTAACSNGSDTKSAPIEIGAVLTLSGENAFWGKNAQHGMDLAVEEVNQQGGVLGRPLRILYEDSKSNPNDAVAAAQKLVSVNRVSSIVGDTMSSNILAIAPICERNKVVLLNFGVAAQISSAGDYIFRNWNSSTSDAKFTSRYAMTQYKNFAVLYQNDSYGISSKEAFVSELTAGGAKVVYSSTFEREQTDFRSLLADLKRQSFEALYVGSYYKEALSFLRQAKELNVRLPVILGTSEWDEKTLADFAKTNYPSKVFYGYPVPPDDSVPIRKHFVEAYQSKFATAPAILSDNGYDAILMLKFGMEKSHSVNATAIKDALYGLKDFQGASGLMSFDKNGDVDKPFGLKTIGPNGATWVK